MMRYKTPNDGRTYEALTEEELVSQMHALSFAPPTEDDATWMKEAAKRATEQSGKPVRYSNAYDFVTDLIAIGFITVGEGK